VIRKDHKESANRGHTVYRVEVSCKDGAEEFGPGLPDPPLFEKDDDFRTFLYTKFINSERASYSAPGFAKALERTRQDLLMSLYEQYYPIQSGGWAGF